MYLAQILSDVRHIAETSQGIIYYNGLYYKVRVSTFQRVNMDGWYYTFNTVLITQLCVLKCHIN